MAPGSLRGRLLKKVEFLVLLLLVLGEHDGRLETVQLDHIRQGLPVLLKFGGADGGLQGRRSVFSAVR